MSLGKLPSTAPWDVPSAWEQLTTEDGLTYYYNAALDVTQTEQPACLASAMDSIETDDYVWVADAKHGFLPGRVLEGSIDAPELVETELGRQVRIKASARRSGAQPCYPLRRAALRADHDDLVQMGVIDEGIILHNLASRFKRDVIYTNIGSILIVVNPYKWFKIYGTDVMESYRAAAAAPASSAPLPPHIFAIAANAYTAMSDALTNGSPPNQSILISGESGAGKTEATKQALRYLAHVAGSSVDGVESRLLKANPLLEAFGNAATLRNYNSSRFGKWMEVFFDDSRAIVGANITNYLLEKSRVTQQAPGERNYHIFYELCVAAPPALRKQLGLGPPSSFAYTSTTTTIAAKHWSDAANFAEVMDAFSEMGMADVVEPVLSLVAAVLHLGNLEFVPGAAEGASAVASRAPLGHAARLLGVAEDALEQACTVRALRMARRETVLVPLSPADAANNRDALAKSLYSLLFDWLVTSVNASIAAPPDASVAASVGILDIFGFEIFETNSFEQLCINYTNEKLQQHFNQHTFKLEQQLYAAEGISYTAVTFVDNQPCLDLIEGKPAGILHVLDEEVLAPSGSDARFVDKLLTKHEGKSERFGRALSVASGFTVHHYAGAVAYDATGFVEKNKDRLEDDLLTLVTASTSDFLKSLFATARDSAASNRKKSIGAQFRTQLNDLMEELNATEPHYVRCIKPNSVKKPAVWDGHDCLMQLRYAGVFEAVAIRQTGYPWRLAHAAFIGRYGMFNSFNRVGAPAQICGEIIAAASPALSSSPDIQIGRTRVLYRAAAHNVLEIKRSLALTKAALSIQRVFRGFRARTLYAAMRSVYLQLKDAMATRQLAKLRPAVNAARAMWFQLGITDTAEALCVQLEDEAELSVLAAALVDKDPESHYEQIMSVIGKADKYALALPELETLRANVASIHVRKQALKDIVDGTADHDRERITKGLSVAASLGLDVSSLTGPADVALKAIAAEEKLLASVSSVLSAASPLAGASADALDAIVASTAPLSAALAKLRGARVKTPAGRELLAQVETTLALRTAIAGADWTALGKHVAAARDLGLESSQDVVAAAEGLELRKKMHKVAGSLRSAMEAKSAPALRGALAQGDALGMASSLWSSWIGLMEDAGDALAQHEFIVETVNAALSPYGDRRLGPLRAALEAAASYGFVAAEDLELVDKGQFVLQTREAIADQDFEELADIVGDAKRAGIKHHELDAAARGLSLRRLMSVVADYLTESMADRYLRGMEESLAKALELDMEDSLWSSWHDLIPEAAALVARHREVTSGLLAHLGPGTHGDIEGLQGALLDAREFGFAMEGDLMLIGEAKFTLQIRVGLAHAEFDAVTKAVSRAYKYDLVSPEIEAAADIVDLRAEMARLAGKLARAVKKHDGVALAALLVDAAALNMGDSVWSSWHDDVAEATNVLRKYEVLVKLLRSALYPDRSVDASAAAVAADDAADDSAAALEAATLAAGTELARTTQVHIAELDSALRKASAFGFAAAADAALVEAAQLVLTKRKALARGKFAKIAKVVAVARELGFEVGAAPGSGREMHPELVSAREMLKLRKKMKTVAVFLSDALAARDMAAVDEGLEVARRLGLDSSPWSSWGGAVADAVAFRAKYEAVRNELMEAMKVAPTIASGVGPSAELYAALDMYEALELRDEGDLVLEERASALLAMRLAVEARDFDAIEPFLGEDYAYLALQETSEGGAIAAGMELRQTMAPVAESLEEAMLNRSLSGLRAGLDAAAKLGMGVSIWSSWGALLISAGKVLSQHKSLRAQLIKAMAPETSPAGSELDALVETASSFGFTETRDTQLVVHVGILAELRSAVSAGAWSDVEAILGVAGSHGLDTAETQEAAAAFAKSELAQGRSAAQYVSALQGAMVDALNDSERPLRSLLTRIRLSGVRSPALTTALAAASELMAQLETVRALLTRGLKRIDAQALKDGVELAAAIGYASADVASAQVLLHELAQLAAMPQRASGVMEDDETAEAVVSGLTDEAAAIGDRDDGGVPAATLGSSGSKKKSRRRSKKKVLKVDEDGVPLPPDWRMVFDDVTGNNYFVHTVTRETTWERPQDAQPRKAGGVTESEAPATGGKVTDGEDDGDAGGGDGGSESENGADADSAKGGAEHRESGKQNGVTADESQTGRNKWASKWGAGK
ncbi:uncharacterized protein AMSG_02747 [Thecamonas trahens ATCC 50062]|uniref:Uncharacterized protein n=1 Tax=Thecamonas trahens ATCC 50062 TaxID=461836 RepID=A0A0L0D1Q9_THETB|nr:hypothetical protein AMSG_02747 [Thecamonas trahens ATCC 50062]KNC46294.1 hypothetical protein AMSG_02747 [Thecamonas trahens ATCC 50062]|eukprot:XP_013760588.1 hypothetical protein AMSG_02747 [Thecamonas trahens ATCC 50062]